MDYVPIYTNVRTILGETTDTLPNTDPRLVLIVKAIVRRFWLLDTQVATAWTSDPINAATQDDKDAFHEFIAWTASLRLYNMPRADGDEIIQKLKIGQLELTYLRQGLSDLNEFFQKQAIAANRTISLVAARRATSLAAGSGKPKVHIANPARSQAALTPPATGPITVLFTMPFETGGD